MNNITNANGNKQKNCSFTGKVFGSMFTFLSLLDQKLVLDVSTGG